jgi:isochorismate pyruvate lyase
MPGDQEWQLSMATRGVEVREGESSARGESFSTMKPSQCRSLADVRAEIDRLDREIIRALGERFEYVKAAARFKADSAEVAAPDRVAVMLEQRRAWAVESGLNPDVVERLYRDLVSYFISEEQKHFQR